jgi:hypothetical protein
MTQTRQECAQAAQTSAAAADWGGSTAIRATVCRRESHARNRVVRSRRIVVRASTHGTTLGRLFNTRRTAFAIQPAIVTRSSPSTDCVRLVLHSCLKSMQSSNVLTGGMNDHAYISDATDSPLDSSRVVSASLRNLTPFRASPGSAMPRKRLNAHGGDRPLPNAGRDPDSGCPRTVTGRNTSGPSQRTAASSIVSCATMARGA